MKSKIVGILAITVALTVAAMAQGSAPGFTEANSIVDGADSLVDAILPVIATAVGVGVALSLVKMVKRK